ncbi:hypothetical protein ACIO8F_02755 [Streptomyces sp. NPDC087228]|uniref:hypothetical protein n=1 Tax=Streptomyces sp. NPDC087228 TaxID=3365772 RepID=UPI00382398AD
MLDGSGSATHAGDSPVMRENRAAGSRAWSGGRAGTKGATDDLVQIQGYASKTSVSCGESIDFHLSSHVAQERTVAIYRIGHYGGSGARHLVTSDGVHVRPRTKPSAAAVHHLPRHPPLTIYWSKTNKMWSSSKYLISTSQPFCTFDE